MSTEKTLMQAEINEAIQKHLPGQVGATLAAELERISALEEEVAARQSTINELQAEVAQLKNERSELKETVSVLKAKESDIKQREFEANAKQTENLRREVLLESRILNAQLEASRQSHQDLLALANVVFRNHQIKQTVTTFAGESEMGNPSNNYQPVNRNSTSTVTTTTEENLG